MVNLLPQETKRGLVRRYYLRYATLVFVGLATALLIGGTLLIPSYLTSRESANSYERYRDALEGVVGLKERAAVTTDMARLGERVRIMETYAESALTADLIDAVGEEVTAGISVRSLSFTRTDQGATVTLGGDAATRQALLSFADALRAASAFSEAALPVSQLVAERDIGFSIQAVYEKR